MKKLGLLVAPLLVIPFIAACNNGGGDKPEEAIFLLSSDPIEVVDKTATVKVDWTPNNIIRFESFTFTATPTKPNSVTFDQTGDPRPMTVKITFTEDITEDISGTLSFEYEDVTAKSKGESSIKIAIPKPDPTVTQEEFSHAINFEGITRMQTEEVSTLVEAEGTYETMIKDETSEFICHTTQIQKLGTEESTTEVYAKIENIGDEECTAVYGDGKGHWNEPYEADSNKFPFVTSYYSPFTYLQKNFTDFEPSLEYEHFDFVDNKYVYKGNAKRDGETDTFISATLTFKNKTLKKFSFYTGEEEHTQQAETTYAFDDVVPTWPL